MKGTLSALSRESLPDVAYNATLTDVASDPRLPNFIGAIRRSDAFDLVPDSTMRRYRVGQPPIPIKTLLAFPHLIRALLKDADLMTDEERADLIEELKAGSEKRADVQRRTARVKKG